MGQQPVAHGTCTPKNAKKPAVISRSGSDSSSYKPAVCAFLRSCGFELRRGPQVAGDLVEVIAQTFPSLTPSAHGPSEWKSGASCRRITHDNTSISGLGWMAPGLFGAQATAVSSSTTVRHSNSRALAIGLADGVLGRDPVGFGQRVDARTHRGDALARPFSGNAQTVGTTGDA
jgi:hypothetical protein